MKKKQSSEKLLSYRKQIDKIDQQIARSLYKRATFVSKIWKWKKANGLPLIDQKREGQILKKIQTQARPPLRAKTLKKIYQIILQEQPPPKKRLSK